MVAKDEGTRKPKSKLKRNLIIVLYLLIIAALIVVVYALPSLKGAMEKTVIIEYGELPVVDKADVLIVRDETLFLSSRSGKIENPLKEGTKVRNGVPILDVTSGSGSDNEYADILARASGSAEVTENFTAPFTGIVSYYVDGYEKKYAPDKISEITKEDLENTESDLTELENTSIQTGQPIYKLTDNNIWYMVFFVDAQTGQNAHFIQDTTVNVNLGGKQVRATTKSITQKGDDFMVVLQSDMYYERMAQFRKMTMDVVSAEYSGLIVDQKSLYKKDDRYGVWARQENGRYQWIPVNIIRQTGAKSIISSGTYIDADGNSVPTVSYYEEILYDPIAEGY
ncbi:MAG: hypothetical protein LBN22_05795 [Clostridiales Family XIII bacterium]|jgi:putative membrane fusion protein|nr:hypothetical protein [Clostridiales Family XIII bacterium]